MRTSEKGFTLIELLMVIAIIGFVSSVVLISIDSARLKARDARRISDIKQIQNALELYALNNNGLYPTVSNTYAYLLSSTLVPNYIATVPEDPTRTSSYRYRYATANGSTDRTSYTMLIDMEKDGTSQCLVQMPLYTSGAGYANWEQGGFPKCW